MTYNITTEVLVIYHRGWIYLTDFDQEQYSYNILVFATVAAVGLVPF